MDTVDKKANGVDKKVNDRIQNCQLSIDTIQNTLPKDTNSIGIAEVRLHGDKNPQSEDNQFVEINSTSEGYLGEKDSTNYSKTQTCLPDHQHESEVTESGDQAFADGQGVIPKQQGDLYDEQIDSGGEKRTIPNGTESNRQDNRQKVAGLQEATTPLGKNIRSDEKQGGFLENGKIKQETPEPNNPNKSANGNNHRNECSETHSDFISVPAHKESLRKDI